MLEQALVAHGSTTPKGKSLMSAIQALAKGFGKDEDQAQAIMPAELKSALMSSPGGAPPPSPGGPPQPGPAESMAAA